MLMIIFNYLKYGHKSRYNADGYEFHYCYMTYFAAHLGEELETYVAENLPQVKVIRTGERQGLIRARIFGADHATGEVCLCCHLPQNFRGYVTTI